MAKNDPCSKCRRPSTDGYLRNSLCHNCDQRYRSRIGYQCTYVDAATARAHVRALQDAGLGLRPIAAAAGIDRKILQCLMTGRAERRSGPSLRISRKTHDRILAVPIPEPLDSVIADRQLVDAVDTIRRLQALVAFGYSRSELARRIGWTPANFGRLVDVGTGKVTAITARTVAALFTQLQMTPGSSVRARNEGRRKNWPLPMDWDEDDLDRFVVNLDADVEAVSDTTTLHFADRYVELHDVLGLSDTEVARRMGIEVESLQRQKGRHADRIDDARQTQVAV